MKMYKLIGVMVVLALFGCGERHDRAEQRKYTLPDELKDCKIFFLESTNYNNLTVMRCPNSTTSTSYDIMVGKTRARKTNIVEDSP